MSKLNPLIKESKKFDSEKLAGGMGMKSAKQKNYPLLRRAVLANLLWEDVAYIDGVSIANEISRLIPLCTPEEVANLAVEARVMQKLRHIPLFLVVEMCKYPEHKKLVKDILPKIITRADMITDCLAIYARQNGGKINPLSHALRNGLAKCFENFNEFQFAKYDRSAKIKLCDVISLVHPIPETSDRSELYKKITERKLSTPDTWEVALSTGQDKKETWTRLITEGKLGGLAMLRNIANMRKADVDKEIIVKGLKELKSQMLLPLNFLTSARMNNEFSRDIDDAMIESYKHLPKLPGRTLFIVDVSGSMGHIGSSNSSFTTMDRACAMAMLASNQCEKFELVLTAGNDSTSVGKHAHLKYPKRGFEILDQIRDMIHGLGGGGIFTRQCLEWCKEYFKDKKFDRIIIFSDSQDCDRMNKVPKPFGKYNYICDVSSHRKGVNFKNVWTAEISGWSEHFLTYISALEGIENNFQDE